MMAMEREKSSQKPRKSDNQPLRFRFTKAQHLHKPAEFQRVYDLKQRAGDAFLLVFGAPNQLGWTRIGLSVSKKHGKAVVRQRIKRLLREAFRLSQHELPVGLDLILIPRPGRKAGLSEYRNSLKKLVHHIERKVKG